VSAAVRKQRRAPSEGSFLRGEAMVPGHSHELEALARDGDNRGKRGRQFGGVA